MITNEMLFFNNPSQIYNVNETGTSLEHWPAKVIVKKGRKRCIAKHLTEIK